LEVMPYISKEYDGKCDHLRSFEIARQLLHEYLKPKAYNNELLVIVTRRLKKLGLATEDQSLDFVLYNPQSEARRAPLTPNSRGGKAILRWCDRLS